MRSLNSEQHILELCSIQADIFESSVDEKKDCKDFVSNYMKSIYAMEFDKDDYWISFTDKVEIINEINKISKNNGKTVLNKSVLRFIGYFYRYYCHKYKIASVLAWKKIGFDYLYDNYEVLHSFDIDKACEVVYQTISLSNNINSSSEKISIQAQV